MFSLDKLITLLFNLSLSGYFVYSFLYPIETNYWLVQSGFLIIFLEFFSFFVTLSTTQILGKKSGWSFGGSPWAGIIIPAILAFFMCFAFDNLLLFGYFILTSAVKAFSLYNKKDAISEGTNIAYSVVVFIISIFIAYPLSFISIFFPEQNLIYQEFFELLPGKHSGSIVDNPFLIVSWGVIYFTISALLAFLNLPKIGRKKTKY